MLFTLLKGLRSDGRPILVKDTVICHVMSTVYNTYRPQLGNMYFMLNQVQAQPRNDMKTLTELVVQIMYDTIKTEYEMEENNKKLTIWTTVLGDFNEHSLRSHAPIKVNDNNINKVRFNMNY